MDGNARVNKYEEMEGVVFPACGACGKPYRPTVPVDAFTLMFRSNDWLANALFKVERCMREMRKKRMRKI